ncbi:hypothetical protein A3Q56_06520, partial [Intoshia linei]
LDATLCDYMTHTTSFGTEFYAAPEQLNSKYYDIKSYHGESGFMCDKCWHSYSFNFAKYASLKFKIVF